MRIWKPFLFKLRRFTDLESSLGRSEDLESSFRRENTLKDRKMNVQRSGKICQDPMISPKIGKYRFEDLKIQKDLLEDLQ